MTTPLTNTEIIAFLDESGSMRCVRDSTIKGFNDFLEAQKKLSGNARLTLIKFNSRATIPYRAAPLDLVNSLSDYDPNGATLLNDTLGNMLSVERARIENDNWADLVVVLVITDGEDAPPSNHINEFPKEVLVSTIKYYEETLKWKFIYTAADIDHFKGGSNVGMRGVNSKAYQKTAQGTNTMFAANSAAVASYRSGATESQAMEVMDRVLDGSTKTWSNPT